MKKKKRNRKIYILINHKKLLKKLLGKWRSSFYPVHLYNWKYMKIKKCKEETIQRTNRIASVVNRFPINRTVNHSL